MNRDIYPTFLISLKIPRRSIFCILKFVALATAILLCGWIDGSAQTVGSAGSAMDCATGKVNLPADSTPVAVIPLSLARGAVSIVAFPADDRIRYLHEGNSKFAFVFDSPTKQADHSIAIFPGADFSSDQNQRDKALSPDATITLQMVSGTTIVLEISAVAEIRRNSNLCVVSYTSPKPISASNIQPPDDSKNIPDMRTPDETARQLIEKCLSSVRPCADNWTPPQNGLSLAAGSPVVLDGDKRLVVVAIRNLTSRTLAIADGFPVLRVETPDDRNRILLTVPVRIDKIFRMLADDVIPASGTAYLALVYRAPVTGVRQRLAVIAAQTEAADDPVSVIIPRD